MINVYLTAKVVKYILLFSFFLYICLLLFCWGKHGSEILYELSIVLVKAENCRTVGMSEIVMVFLDCAPNWNEADGPCFQSGELTTFPWPFFIVILVLAGLRCYSCHSYSGDGYCKPLICYCVLTQWWKVALIFCLFRGKIDSLSSVHLVLRFLCF